MLHRATQIGLSAQHHQHPQGQNENYVYELMELHTQSLEGGYTQTDVNTVFPGYAMPAFLDMFQDR